MTGQSQRRLSANCIAPLSLTEEVSRLLVSAAAHATRSSACVDGPGTRVTIDRIVVCPRSERAAEYQVDLEYRVTRHREGDTRACSAGDDCSWLRPVSTEHAATLRFLGPPSGLRLQAPSTMPGLEDATPLDRPHQGGCYGSSSPFSPQVIRLR